MVMKCPKCGKKYSYTDKIDFACLVVWGKCKSCLEKEGL